MEHLIIDVVIGLLLIYIAGAFLLMKVQESVHGAYFRGRVSNLLCALNEAVGNDQSLKKTVLGNRLISSLWSGEAAPRPAGLFTRAQGPSHIPGDLFAKALLMSLNPSGKLPSTEGRMPLAFMDDLMKSEASTSERYSYLQALRGLVPSNTSGWPEFELAIGTWFTDICDRSEGWFKRSSELVGLALALFLCVAINIDTCHIVNVLGSDTQLREGFGALGELVVQQNRNASGVEVKPAPIDPALDPTVRSVARLRDAQRHIVEVFRKDRAIAAYGVNETDTYTECSIGRSAEEATVMDASASAAAADRPSYNYFRETNTSKNAKLVKEWHNVTLPAATAGAKAASAPGDGKPAKTPDGRYLSNSDTWVLVLTRLQPALQGAIHRVDSTKENERTLREIYGCLSQVNAWVNSALVVSKDADSRNLMLEAAKAIEDSASSILAVLRNAESMGGLRNLFRIDPEAFDRCVGMKLQGLSALNSCVLKEQTLMSRLPVGHSASNWRQQFCKVDSLGKTDSQEQKDHFGDQQHWPCNEKVLEAQPQLGLQPLRLVPDYWGWATVLGGFIISALFISLGAPALFGLLNKFVDLRNAGRVRDAKLSAVEGGGTLPLPMLALPQIVSDTAAAAIGVAPAKVGTLPTIEGAQPGFEQGLTDREVQALKQRLGVQPSTGGIDAATRAAIQKETGSAQLTLASFTQLMGRAPVQAGPSVGALPSVLPQLRQPSLIARTLADNLNIKTSFPNRVDINTVTTFNDEMRAMSVLYRFAKGGSTTSAAPIFQTVIERPQQLDQIDEKLLNDILGSGSAVVFSRTSAAPWLDIALGELGQVESNGSSRSTSNPRVCEYLDAVDTKLGDHGDTTAWCAAFVTWVLQHPHALGGATKTTTSTNANFKANKSGLLVPAKEQAAAASWRSWQRPDTGTAAAAPIVAGGNPVPLPGDVVVISPESGKFHVGFVFEVNTTTNEFWLLGGNQRGGTRVSLWKLPLSAIL